MSDVESLPRREDFKALAEKRAPHVARIGPSRMSRIHDLGGAHGFGPLAIESDEPPFHHEWEARVFAINARLLRAGWYTLDEFRDAIESMPPAQYLAASYYERWLFALETLVERHAHVRDR